MAIRYREISWVHHQASTSAHCQIQPLFEERALLALQGPAAVNVIIPRVAKALGAVVTVMVTVARTGFLGALIGNTAEVVIDKLESDILVLKPDEIVEHLEQLASKL